MSPEWTIIRFVSVSKNHSNEMAGATGLEPAAFCVTGRRYNQT